MTNIANTMPSSHASDTAPLRAGSGWIIALGIVYVIAGFIALGSVMMATVASVLIVGVMMISNITGTKGVLLFPSINFTLGPIEMHGLVTDGAFYLFPLAYILGDVISEVYGFKAMRQVVLAGFAVLLLASLCFWITLGLPRAPFYDNQQSFKDVAGVVPQFLAAGLAGYVVGELLNSLVMVKMKARAGEGSTR